MKTGFDNEKYLQMQSSHIRERISHFDNKLYLEFGGKLFDDYHASRVLPGFQPNSKMRMLMQLSSQAEIIIVISADDIEKNKIRGDLGITYDVDVLRLMSVFRRSSRETPHYTALAQAIPEYEKLLDEFTKAFGLKPLSKTVYESRPNPMNVTFSFEK